MTFLEDLRQNRESYTSAYLQFTVQPYKSSDEVHTFFEGQDDLSFYYNFLIKYVKKQELLHSYRCGSKKEVYKVYEKIKESRGSQRKALFFVDKDLSDLLKDVAFVDSNIFVTEYYSIENYLVSEEMLFRIYSELFHLTGSEFPFTNIKDKFEVERTHFYEYMQPITAWIIYAMRHSLRPNINNINFSKLFRWSDDLILQETDECKSLGIFTMLEQMCGIKIVFNCQPELDKIAEELKNLDPKSYIRGKLELIFFVKFLDKLYIVLSNTLKNRFSLNIRITERNALEILGPRVSLPKALEKFLDENIPKKEDRMLQDA